MALETVEVALDELQEAKQNPRKGNVEVIMESLRTNGQYRPIVVRKSTSEILAGNHTFKAARELGWDTISVVYVDVDDDQAKRIIIADNRTSDLATNDDELLSAMLQSLDAGLEGTGYDEDDVQELRRITGEYADDAMAALSDALGEAGETRVPPRERPEFEFMVSFQLTAPQRAMVMLALTHLVSERELENTSEALHVLAADYAKGHDLKLREVELSEGSSDDGDAEDPPE